MFMKKNNPKGKKPTFLDKSGGTNQQLMYEKRVKDYKNQSENKYIN